MKNILVITFALLFLYQHTTNAQNFPAAQWNKVKSPAFYGWNQSKLDAIESYIVDSTATTGMMIIQNGRIIYEYGNTTENSYIASCRKSILAMLYGKYVENGTIELDKSLTELGIDYDGLLLDIEKTATVKDIISSRSGIYLPAANSGDMTHLAPKRGSVKPGDFWIYNNWDFNMAGYIFEKQTKKNIYDEIDSQFAIPLQMEDWDRSIQEKSGDILVTDVLAYHINFSARDMARLGVLMLNKGKWMGQQIIPAFWVEEITKPFTSFEEVDKIAPHTKNEFSGFAYGYMWWLWHNPKHGVLENAYSAQGAWGQNITIIPNINTVVVIKTNDLYLRQKGNHGFMIDQIAQAYSPQLNKELKQFAESLTKNDVAQFIQDYSNTPPKSDSIDFQNHINTLAYYYLSDVKEYGKALMLFKLNVAQHSSSWLAYDGLAEAYFVTGDFKKSLGNYQKTILLNTRNEWNNNERAAYIIKHIKSKKN